MNALQKENPGMAGTTTGAEIDTNISRNSTDTNARQAVRDWISHVLIMLASRIVRIAHRRLEENIPADWDAALSLQLDRLIDVRERLAEYLEAERRNP